MIKRKEPSQKRPLRPKFLIVCEGKVTEKIYLNGVRVDHSLQHDLFELEFAAGTPRTIVDRAVALKRINDKVYRRDPLLRYSEVWCVFDRDVHDWVPEAFDKATANRVHIAFSNPNFELFLVLHFQDCFRAYDRHQQARLLQQHLPGYEKSFDYSIVRTQYETARARATEVNKRASFQGQVPQAPYTSVHELIDSIVGRLTR